MTLRSLCAVLLAGLAAPAFAADDAALADHLRESYNVPAAINVTFSSASDAGVPGFKKRTVTFARGENTSSETLWVSDDGRHYLLGGFKDLKVHPDQERLAKMDLSGSPARGPKDAKVTVVQYTDFQCPFCSKGFELMRDGIMKDFPGKVRWVYKSLPLVSIHPWAEPGAMAAECAKEQGTDKFWAVHDKLFENQREITLENLEEKTGGYLKAAKGDLKAFEACVESKKTLPTVARDTAEADALGISGTPAFVVNGHFISGADYVTIKRVVEEALKGKHGKP